MVSEKELEQIQERMKEAGILNRSAFVRRMCMKGYVINVDISFVRELLCLHRRSVNNLKQIAAHANAHGIYVDEISELQRGYDELWLLYSDLLKHLTALLEL
jgi:hypothetical protein